MGNTNETITDILHRFETSVGKYRRALRREDQLVIDDLIASAYKHRAASSYSGHLVPFQTFLLSMLIEEHKEVMLLREAFHDMPRLRGEVAYLRRKVTGFELFILERSDERIHWVAARPVSSP
jgi:hypothetical protein